MNRLKEENSKKCMSLLREFIDGAQAQGNQKSIAILALNQLQSITAGTGSGDEDKPDIILDNNICDGRPRADI